MSLTKRTGLVLSGGGARGAYEAGILSGIIEVLGLLPKDKAPFEIFAGTSVGAINATYAAAHAHRGDLNVRELTRLWTGLRIDRHLRIDVMGFLGIQKPKMPFFKARQSQPKARFGHYFLDPRQLERLVLSGVPWGALRDNVKNDRVHALIVAALHIGSGRTTMFAELAPGAEFHPSRDPRRVARMERITGDHVLASAAIPMVFPARRVGESYYCDGGIRFNTPMAPAIRAGATRLVVVSLLRQPPESQIMELEAEHEPEQFPHPAFIIGKILNALLLDPVAYDLYVLDRFNKLLEVLAETHTTEEMDRLNDHLVETRGRSYRQIDCLAFHPSGDIGQLAAKHLIETGQGGAFEKLRYWLLGWAGGDDRTWEADLASYILFDGRFAEKLIEMGKQDALARADEISAFFAR